MPSHLHRYAIPVGFVVIWATGFIVARTIPPFVEPMTFLALRFACTALVLGAAALVVRAPWPRSGREWRTVLGIGLLIQGVYLGGVFWAVARGLPAGVSALIASAQPLLTACLAGPLLGERVSRGRAIGIALGFAGTGLVLAPRLTGAEGYPLPALAASLASVAGITLGAIWQKRSGAAIDLRSATAIHFAASAGLTLAVALATETGRITPALPLWLGLGWSIFGLSIGAVGLLLVMIRRGEMVAVSAWLFLVPPIASLMSFALFDERLGGLQLLGMAVATAGVALATRA